MTTEEKVPRMILKILTATGQKKYIIVNCLLSKTRPYLLSVR